MISNYYFPQIHYKTFSERMPLWFKIALPIGILLLVIATAVTIAGGTKQSLATRSVAQPAVSLKSDLYLSVWVNPADKQTDKDRQLLGWFDSNERLAWYKSDCVYVVYDSHSQKYKVVANNLPAVMLRQKLVDSSFRVLYSAQGDGLPQTDTTLYYALKANTPACR